MHGIRVARASPQLHRVTPVHPMHPTPEGDMTRVGMILLVLALAVAVAAEWTGAVGFSPVEDTGEE